MPASTARGPPSSVAVLLAVAGLVVLAGCSSLLGLGGPGDRSNTATPATAADAATPSYSSTATEGTPAPDADAEPTGTTTPQSESRPPPVPSAGPPNTYREIPPGITAAGRVDALALARAHSAVVRNHSVMVTHRRTERYANGTLRFRRIAVEYADTRGRYYRLERLTGDGSILRGHSEGWYERWANATVGVAALRTGDRVSYDRELPGRPRIGQFDRLYSLVSILEPRVIDRRRVDGTPVLVLRAVRSTATDRLTAGGLASPRNVSLLALVDENGLVRAYRLRYTATADAGTVRVREQVTFEDLGSTTVPRPRWVGTALAAPGDRPDSSNTTEAGGVLTEPPGRRDRAAHPRPAGRHSRRVRRGAGSELRAGTGAAHRTPAKRVGRRPRALPSPSAPIRPPVAS